MFVSLINQKLLDQISSNFDWGGRATTSSQTGLNNSKLNGLTFIGKTPGRAGFPSSYFIFQYKHKYSCNKIPGIVSLRFPCESSNQDYSNSLIFRASPILRQILFYHSYFFFKYYYFHYSQIDQLECPALSVT